MPLSEKTRIEVYLPDLPLPAYQKLLAALQREFTHAFGGSTIIRGLDGTYLSGTGVNADDYVNLLYGDANLDFEFDADLVDRYADALRRATYRALNEEAVLVAVYRVRHSAL